MYNVESIKLMPHSHERMPPRRHSSDHSVSGENRCSEYMDEYIDRPDVTAACITGVTAGTAFATPITGTDLDEVTAETMLATEADRLLTAMLVE